MTVRARTVLLLAVSAACLGFAAWRLWSARPGDERGIREGAEALAARVADADEGRAVAAVVDLGRLGARACAPRVGEALRDPRPRVRAAAATALGRLRVWETVPGLLAALEDPDVLVRQEADTAIVRIIGVDYEFDPRGSEAVRAAGIRRVRENYPANHPGYLDWLKRAGFAPPAE